MGVNLLKISSMSHTVARSILHHLRKGRTKQSPDPDYLFLLASIQYLLMLVLMGILVSKVWIFSFNSSHIVSV